MTMIDLTGMNFGLLKVERRHGSHRTPGGQTKPTWECRCACGNVLIVRGSSLRTGNTQSCGCRRKGLQGERDGMIGLRSGRLVVREFFAIRHETLCWLCDCECGKTSIVRGSSLRKGQVLSCGCLALERSSAAKRKSVVKYLSAHDRIRRARGSASAHSCVDCEGPAIDWAYDGGDPDELHEVVGGSNLAYSLDVSRYSPRCRRCHRRFDSVEQRTEVSA